MRRISLSLFLLVMLSVIAVGLQAGVLEEKKQVDAYMDAAVQEEGAEKSSSGLIYIPLTAGTGESPKATDTVKVHYTGSFVNGDIFDSSVKRNKPAEFPLNAVIACWTEGLQKMKVGGKAKLVCPPRIAYGEKGRPSIPPNSTLVFVVELLDIKKAE